MLHGAWRRATVTCYSDVELLAVSRQDLVDVSRLDDVDCEPQFISFLRTVDVLRGWPIDLLPYNKAQICAAVYFRSAVCLYLGDFVVVDRRVLSVDLNQTLRTWGEGISSCDIEGARYRKFGIRKDL